MIGWKQLSAENENGCYTLGTNRFTAENVWGARNNIDSLRLILQFLTTYEIQALRIPRNEITRNKQARSSSKWHPFPWCSYQVLGLLKMFACKRPRLEFVRPDSPRKGEEKSGAFLGNKKEEVRPGKLRLAFPLPRLCANTRPLVSVDDRGH